ncbi:hypothetical protein BC827DRAFT_85291 [Russula dissimulans]|nr:hypothetical protein BC827DRAFT_85291 [Russula dissimulans]
MQCIPKGLTELNKHCAEFTDTACLCHSPNLRTVWKNCFKQQCPTTLHQDKAALAQLYTEYCVCIMRILFTTFSADSSPGHRLNRVSLRTNEINQPSRAFVL